MTKTQRKENLGWQDEFTQFGIWSGAYGLVLDTMRGTANLPSLFLFHHLLSAISLVPLPGLTFFLQTGEVSKAMFT